MVKRAPVAAANAASLTKARTQTSESITGQKIRGNYTDMDGGHAGVITDPARGVAPRDTLLNAVKLWLGGAVIVSPHTS